MLDNPQALQRFEQAQSQLGSALQRLMIVVERSMKKTNYPTI